MQAQSYLLKYSKRADSYLSRFFEKKAKQAERTSPLAREIIEVFARYSRGGKKVRGALTVLGYQVAGAKDIEKILPASCGIELFHSFLLIHDDLIDQDKLRRGKPTVHEYFKDVHKKRYRRGEAGRYGANMAIITGDMGAFLGYELLASAPLPKERLMAATTFLNDFLVKTAYGQIFDITFDLEEKVSWDDILLVRTYKAAYYTIVMPLSIGAVLGGAQAKKLRAIEDYGVPVGIAFQIADDILGVFGEEKKTGKTAVGDIREGKRTFLYAKALELAGPEDRKFLEKNYGKADISGKDVEKIRRIFRDCGALEFSSNMAQDLVERGKETISRITKSKEVAQTLASLADFVVEREK